MILPARNHRLGLPGVHDGLRPFDYADRYSEAIAEISDWLAEGRIKSREHVVHVSVACFDETLNILFTGANIGRIALAVKGHTVQVTDTENRSRADQTRARLHDAAVVALTERGFHGTTTREITSIAGVSTGAVDVHHRSKEELLYQVSRAGHMDTLERVRTAIASAQDPAGQLLAVMREFRIHHARARIVARIINYELAALSPEHQQEIKEVRLDRARGGRRVVRELEYPYGRDRPALAGNRYRARVPRGWFLVTGGDRRLVRGPRAANRRRSEAEFSGDRSVVKISG